MPTGRLELRCSTPSTSSGRGSDDNGRDKGGEVEDASGSRMVRPRGGIEMAAVAAPTAAVLR